MMIGVERVLILSFFHTMFLPETSQLGSRPVSRETPFCSGPRKLTQSSGSALSCFTARLTGELAAVFEAATGARPAPPVAGFLVAGAAARLREAADAFGVLSDFAAGASSVGGALIPALAIANTSAAAKAGKRAPRNMGN